MTVSLFESDRRDPILYNHVGRKEAPFEVLLKHSTQKQVLAVTLVERIGIMDGEELSFCDIGTSKGTLMGYVVGGLMQRGIDKRIHFTFLEPEKSSVRNLKVYAEALKDISHGRYSAIVIPEAWEEFQPEKYDFINCSHVIYHFDQEKYGQVFTKMIDSLNYHGHLFISARERKGNDVYELIRQYKALASGQTHFNDITIDNALPALQQIVAEDPSLHMTQKSLFATVELPFKSNIRDAKTVMAFFLQHPSWESLPTIVRDDVMGTFGGDDHILGQKDSLIEITKQ